MRLLFHNLLERVEWRKLTLKLDVQGRGGGKLLDVDGQGSRGP